MWYFTQCLYFFLLFTQILSQCHENDYYLIRSIRSGLVVDASTNPQVTLQWFGSFSDQSWIFERGYDPGLFFIPSNYTRTVLDVRTTGPNTYVTYVQLAEKTSSSLTQQWVLNSDGRIINAGLNKTMDSFDAVAGDYLQLWQYDGSNTQQFILQEKV